jgi:hypothetical protein
VFHYKCPACGRFGSTEGKICPRCGRALQDADVYDTERSPVQTCGPVVGWTFLGGILTFAYLSFGVWVAAGGHGRLVPGVAAFFSIITGPGAGLAWALRRTETGWWIALCLMLFELLVDAWIVFINFNNSKGSGVRFEKVWEATPGWVIGWAIAFLAHQLVAPMIVFCHKRLAPRSEERI